MRVVSRMRAAAPGRAIVAGLAILAGCALAGCGQRGSLYLPTVPPLPAKPIDRTQPPSPDTVKSGAATPSTMGEVPDTSGAPLSLAPKSELSAPPASAATPAQAASAVTPAQ
ncbi:lipoprotein [Paraburkholderia nemoris]|uniref:LPS translocon maturation chaperone LptM n=1 Tax=Paraburkholderia nemoris TaxID=2793076 RepID=UPI0038BB7D84